MAQVAQNSDCHRLIERGYNRETGILCDILTELPVSLLTTVSCTLKLYINHGYYDIACIHSPVTLMISCGSPAACMESIYFLRS